MTGGASAATPAAHSLLTVQLLAHADAALARLRTDRHVDQRGGSKDEVASTLARAPILPRRVALVGRARHSPARHAPPDAVRRRRRSSSSSRRRHRSSDERIRSVTENGPAAWVCRAKVSSSWRRICGSRGTGKAPPGFPAIDFPYIKLIGFTDVHVPGARVATVIDGELATASNSSSIEQRLVSPEPAGGLRRPFQPSGWRRSVPRPYRRRSAYPNFIVSSRAYRSTETHSLPQ